MPAISARAEVIDQVLQVAMTELVELDSEASSACSTTASIDSFLMPDNQQESEGDEADEDLCALEAKYLQDPILALQTSHSDDMDLMPGGPAFHLFGELITNRYSIGRNPVPKSRAQLDMILYVYKVHFPRKFRRWVRINPSTFDALVDILEEHPVFHNKSRNPQRRVAEQLAITLHRLGNYGSGASVEQIADDFGVSVGSVVMCTKRVIIAVLQTPSILSEVQWPSPENRAKAKQQVFERSDGNDELSQGWLMIDGTHVNLFQEPYYCGERFFDRKSNYSLTVQITNLPSGEIVDYTVGDVGSANDSTGLRRTRLYKDQIKDGPGILLGPGEFCWGDSGYPLFKWLILPFGSDETRLSRTRARFNGTLSRIRVTCEHTIGYLKGRFQSLKELRLMIRSEEEFQWACMWVRACIHLHMFAFHDERNPRFMTNAFSRDGMRWERAQHRANILIEEQEAGSKTTNAIYTARDMQRSAKDRAGELDEARVARARLALANTRTWMTRAARQAKHH